MSLLRALPRTSLRMAAPLRASGARRSLATEAQDTRPQVKAAGTLPVSPALRAHTVEELHESSAEEILREGGTRKEASLRHFTVNFGCVRARVRERAERARRITARRGTALASRHARQDAAARQARDICVRAALVRRAPAATSKSLASLAREWLGSLCKSTWRASRRYPRCEQEDPRYRSRAGLCWLPRPSPGLDLPIGGGRKLRLPMIRLLTHLGSQSPAPGRARCAASYS
jgi:hypothetical protein